MEKIKMIQLKEIQLTENVDIQIQIQKEKKNQKIKKMEKKKMKIQMKIVTMNMEMVDQVEMTEKIQTIQIPIRKVHGKERKTQKICVELIIE